MQARFTVLAIPFALLALAHCSSSSDDGGKAAPQPAPDGGGVDAATKPDVPDAATKPDAAAGLKPMTTARSLFAAVNGKDARIRTFAGLSATGLDDTTESYDPI